MIGQYVVAKLQMLKMLQSLQRWLL